MTNKLQAITSGFFSKDILDIAPNLLGHYLVVWWYKSEKIYQINEIEIYRWEEDGACHARKWITKRTQIMYWPWWYRYIYLVYWMYNMINIVCNTKWNPQAILIRWAWPFTWPWKLTRDLWINTQYNWQKASPDNWLWFSFNPHKSITYYTTPRVWINYAPEPRKSKERRFIVHS